jgi:hypothetical protein
MPNRVAWPAAAVAGVVAAWLALAAPAARADGIAPGLWRIVSRTETGGVIGPRHESSRCLTADDVRDPATTFSPTPDTQNSTCTPIEKNLNGQKLTWRLVCKGQLDMEESGEFQFDGALHYTATVRTKATVAGRTMVDSQDTIEARWVSECR